MSGAALRRPAALVAWVRAHPALVLFCGVVGAFYLWTVWSSGSPIAFDQNRTDDFNLLSDGFLKGHLHLAQAPDPRLLALPNPYDPSANGPLKIHDLSLYHGQYYLYWGPTPALLLFLPFRLLPLGDLPESAAVFLFAFTGFCASVAVLRLLVRRFAPGAPRWMLFAAALALAFGNALPFTLRRAAVYEVAITAGFCLAFLAIYLLTTGLLDGVKVKRLAWASLLLGLAVGARPTMIVPALGLVVIAIWMARRTADVRERRTVVLALLGPVAAIGVLLAIYNAARFGDPLQFGQKYQLAGYDPANKDPNKLGYVPPGLWYYLLARPHLTLGFPFVHLAPPPLSYPFTPPTEYDGVENVGGLFTLVPLTLLAPLSVLMLRGRERRVMTSFVAAACVIVVMATFALWGATMRYEVDFASLLIIAAAVGWIAWTLSLHGRLRRVAAIGGAVLIGWGVLCGLAISFTGYYSGLRSSEPGTFVELQRLTSPLPTVLARLHGNTPQLVDAWAPYGLDGDSDPGPGWGTLAFKVGPTPTELTVISGSYRRAGLVLAGTPIVVAPGTPAAAVAPVATGIRISTPDTHRSVDVPATLNPTVLPIALRRGLNRIQLTATGPKDGQSHVEGLRLAAAP